jgi:B12-binding domain/radical SAM domain protein
MYPFGFVTIASYLHKQGYRVRIVNLASLMLHDKNFDVESFIKNLSSTAYGIDLHWLPHAHGSLEVAKIIKEHHPDSKVIFGGFSSTYFHRELINYPQVDMVLRGDSTEIPVASLIETIEKGGDFAEVPNLTWKKDGRAFENPLSFVPADIDFLDVDYGWMIKSVIRYRDLEGFKPFRDWDRYPLTAVFSVRGCTMDCAVCGGSCTAMRTFLGRPRPAFRTPERLAADVYNIGCHFDSPIFVVGDLRQGGKDYARRFFDEVKELGVENHLVLEIFTPADREFFRMASEALEEYSVQFSPDSHEEDVRFVLGRKFDNASIESTVANALSHGCSRFDMFFMIGLPNQTAKSAIETSDYARHLYEKLNQREKLFFYISPLAPFLDPGSRAFEAPEAYGYRVFARTLEEHRSRLLNASWKYVLSYETKWMTRDEIVGTSYEAADRLNKVRFEEGLMSSEDYEFLSERIRLAKWMVKEIDSAVLVDDPKERTLRLQTIKEKADKLMESTICKKRDLEWDTKGVFKSIPRALIGFLKKKKV